MTALEVFICHSAKDSDLALAMIELLRSAFSLPAEAIRCTSVDGYRLPVGAATDEVLREEVYDAKAFIGLITRESLRSPYVLFELGARWGAQKPLAPILAAGADASLLPGPLSGRNALRAEEPAQMLQLVSDLSTVLGRTAGSASAYQLQIDRLRAISAAKSKAEATLMLIYDQVILGTTTIEAEGEKVTFTHAIVLTSLANKATIQIAPVIFGLTVSVGAEQYVFSNVPIPPGMQLGSEVYDFQAPDLSQRDLLRLGRSLAPGEVLIGALMFVSDKVSRDVIKSSPDAGWAFTCTDALGTVHGVQWVRSAPDMPGPSLRLGVTATPKADQNTQD